MTAINQKTIEIGKPIKTPFLIPVRHCASPSCINNAFTVDGEVYKVTCVSFGNPHGVVFADDIENINIATLGEALSNHQLFPLGANIVFVESQNKAQVKTRIWDKANGEVDFSAEGAAAALYALVVTQKLLADSALVEMTGGTAEVSLDRAQNTYYVTAAQTLLNA